ncbi:spore cortex-lytic enzyme [Tumebacillus flagellatus]|uniref:Spore cortex-lytic enzyme n=1 Tax=Tumebacillus flagellatus TaxID=1157490 RepID=A0A074LRF5_9BACL|nr:spore cortex-lytic enzyme [Tumebacillus flagellatus]KEO83659.1 hypothetical protein EL26_08350 [Tumebacillus flagellatus]
MRKKWRLLAAAVTVATAMACVAIEPNLERSGANTYQSAFTTRTLVKGSTGTDVRELQGRLKYIGYYKGKIDGAFGWGTYWAVRNFQYKFGMKIDGKVGPATRTKLVAASRGYNPYAQGRAAASKHTASVSSTPTASYGGRNVSANDMKLISNAVYGESRGEPYVGQVAIAAVILNRLENPNFPHNIPGIIFQPGAFTAVADGQIWLSPNATAKKAVNDAMRGWDPSSGAIYYFNPATATSKWIWSRPQIKRIGRHIFCR